MADRNGGYHNNASEVVVIPTFRLVSDVKFTFQHFKFPIG